MNDATGGTGMHVGHDLRSCTQQVTASEPFNVDGQSIVLFDTPGFDDTTISDADTLKRIAEFLESMYVAKLSSTIAYMLGALTYIGY